MAHDPYEKEKAIVLEYGHTAGHAIEKSSGGRIGHGQAIGLGMLVAAKVSRAMGMLSAGEYAEHERLLNRIGAPVRIPGWLAAERIFEHLAQDNKRGHIPCRAEHLAMVLLSGIGKPCLTGAKPLVETPLYIVRESILGLYGRG
jgi:3-dehydroquinate synthase/2-deoxy-scyllo-inosose synthase